MRPITKWNPTDEQCSLLFRSGTGCSAGGKQQEGQSGPHTTDAMILLSSLNAWRGATSTPRHGQAPGPGLSFPLVHPDEGTRGGTTPRGEALPGGQAW